MKVLLFNGSPHPAGCTYTALHEVEKTLQKHGIETELVQVGTKPVAGCIACRHCKDGSGCVFDDGVNALAARLEEFDALVVGAPVYYSGPSGQCTSFLDRLFYSAGGKLTGKPGAAVVSSGAVVVSSGSGAVVVSSGSGAVVSSSLPSS